MKIPEQIVYMSAIFEPPKYVGAYKLFLDQPKNHHIVYNMCKKPRWFTRLMMKWCEDYK